MNDTTPRPRSGIGFFGAMFLIFLTLKLCGVIGWSWWWVTAPLWGPAILIVVATVIFFIFAAILAAASKRSR